MLCCEFKRQYSEFRQAVGTVAIVPVDDTWKDFRPLAEFSMETLWFVWSSMSLRKFELLATGRLMVLSAFFSLVLRRKSKSPMLLVAGLHLVLICQRLQNDCALSTSLEALPPISQKK